MYKILLIIALITPRIGAEQLSPIQLQKKIGEFQKALDAKNFDDAQFHVTQIKQGGRAANAQELAVTLAQARQKAAEEKYQNELQKSHQTQATRDQQLKKHEYMLTQLKKENEELKKQLKECKEELHRSKEPKSNAAAQAPKPADGRPDVSLSIYQKLTGRAAYAEPHEILKVSKDASGEDIKKSYKQLVLTWHPDKNKDPEAQDAFRLISWAYQKLNK